jgi:hypothetical protein
MSRGRVRQRTKTSTLLNSITIIIIITTIIITIANIADIMMSPASSWYLPDTAVIIITTTITIITASTAATIEVARYRMMKNRTLRVLFFCGLELISSD